MKFLLILILITQTGCSFLVTTTGSFLGNLGAGIAHDKMKDKVQEKKEERKK